jgi:anti-anti-sigma regulatory factor
MDPESLRSAGKSTVKLMGEWTIERAGELKGMLSEGLEGGECIVVDVEEIENVDLSCLQLLCAAHRASLREGKLLTLGGKRPDQFRKRVHEAGFSRALGCHKDPGKSCLWIEGSQS